MSSEEFERVRDEPDPLERARLATALLLAYKQRSAELARLRRLAIDQAAQELGLSFASVAAEIGLSKGRITQIRQTAPPPQRGLFGVGPVTIAVPLRSMAGRALPVIAAEDDAAAAGMSQLLLGLGFDVQIFHIPVGGEWSSDGDVVAICGPKSSRVVAAALAEDPFLAFAADDRERWALTDRATGRILGSPMDGTPRASADLAYVGRFVRPSGSLFVIAGVHAIGSAGAVHYLTGHLDDLYRLVGESSFSGVIRSTFSGGVIEASEPVWTPKRH